MLTNLRIQHIITNTDKKEKKKTKRRRIRNLFCSLIMMHKGGGGGAPHEPAQKTLKNLVIKCNKARK
jgi:hypothetical protein